MDDIPPYVDPGLGGSLNTGGMGGDMSGGSGGIGSPDAGGPSADPRVNPIISRHQLTTQSTGVGAMINDGSYKTSTWNAGRPTVDEPAWVAINIGTGYERLLLSWTASSNYGYTDVVYGAPADYRIETAETDSGPWTEVASVTGNTVRARAHSFDFHGQSWVRLVVTAAPTGSVNGVNIDEIDVHDVSNGSQDTWFFMGDSITAFAYDRATPADQPSFAEYIHAAHPAFFPAMINGGIGGETAAQGLARIDSALALNPDFHFFGIMYGTNDEWGNQTDTTQFRSNMQGIIDKVVAAGRVPVLAKIPASPDGNHNTLNLFNAVIDDLTTTNHLPLGPDMFTWFSAHPEQLNPVPDQVHPNAAGRVAMNRLWAYAMENFYTSP